MARTTRHDHVPMSKSEAGKLGVIARLSTTPWNDMTTAANESPRHVKSLDRWRDQARALNPALDDAQTDRLAELLRSEHYRQLGRRSGAARRGKRPDEQAA